MKKFIQTLFSLLLVTQFCFAQWEWQNPLPTGYPLNNVFFVDSNTGYATCEQGKILKSTDGGENWESQPGFENYNFTAVQFIDANNGIVVGNNFHTDSLGFPLPAGRILRTTDGGKNWTLQAEVNSCLHNVFFIDAFNGIAIGGGSIAGGFGTILRTTDGGENWMIQLCDSINNWNFYGAYFTDVNNGIVVGDKWNPNKSRSVILRTNDGGKNWIEQNSDIMETLNNVQFVNDSIGWIVGGAGYGDNNGIILKTTDGGSNWIRQATTVQFNGINDIYFSDVNNGIAIGQRIIPRTDIPTTVTVSDILRTSDGGNNWIVQSNPTEGIFKSISFLNANTGIVVGTTIDFPQYGIIFKSTDGGNNWVNQIKGTTNELRGVSFTDALNGTAVGRNGTILRTTDGGQHWINQESGTDNWNLGNTINGVSFYNSNIGMAVGRGFILKTNNAEANWFLTDVGGYYLTGIQLVDSLNAWAVGTDGVILHTANGGIDWIPQVSGTTKTLNGVSFTDLNHGSIVGDNGIILRTTDGGEHWFKQAGTYNSLYGICFVDANVGTAVGLNGKILRTIDGGNTWINQPSSTTSRLTAVSFSDMDIGIVTGSGGTILQTFDGGLNWMIHSTGVSVEFTGVEFVDANNVWVVGDNGAILHTSNGGVTFVEEQVINEMPSAFLLTQNYPNPFNTDTKIKYSVPKSSTVFLKVFDIQGRTIDILVNKEKPAGTYEVTWHAGNLPGGVYFYQLNEGGVIETKKMILRR